MHKRAGYTLLSGYRVRHRFKIPTLVTLLAAVCFSTSAIAGSFDPTFNGMVDQLNCSLTAMTICFDNFCFDSTEQSGYYFVSLKRRTYNTFSSNAGGSFEIVEVSPAILGKPLLVKYTYKAKDSDVNGLLFFVPKQTGGYDVRLGLVYKPNNTSPAPTKDGVDFNRIITGGKCSIQSR